MSKQKQNFCITDGNSSRSGSQINVITKLPANVIILYMAAHFCSVLDPCNTAFGLFFPAFLLLANKFRFNNNSAATQAGIPYKSIFWGYETETWFQCYIAFAALIGVIIPFIIVFTTPTTETANAVAPH
eukprot:11719498-Ditylum_brightwellii.AAC.1